MPETTPNPYADLLARLRTDTSQRAVAAVTLELLEHLAHDAYVFETAIGRGPAAYLERVGIDAPAPVQAAAEALPAGWLWGETDAPDAVRAYRDHDGGGYCRFDAGSGFSELDPAPGVRAAVETRARRLGLLTGDADAPPVLPPGCTLDDKGPESWRWCVRGRDRNVVGSGHSPADAVQDAWRRFSTFMSREDYEAMEREAGRAIVDRRTAERFDGLSWQDVSANLDQIAATLGITGVWHLRDVKAACEALVDLPGQGLSRRVRELTMERDEARAERDTFLRDAEQEAARLRAKLRSLAAEARAAERLADQAEKRTEAHRVEVSRLTDTVHRLRADLAEARQVREKLASVTIDGKRYGLVDLGPA